MKQGNVVWLPGRIKCPVNVGGPKLKEKLLNVHVCFTPATF